MRPSPSSEARWLLVEVGGVARSIPRGAVRDVAPLADLTPVPGAPQVVCGLTHLHGRIVTVLDPRCDGRADAVSSLRPRPGDSLLLLDGAGEPIALWAERVSEHGAREAEPAAKPSPVDVEALRRRARGTDGRAGERADDAAATRAALDSGEVRQLQDFFRDEAAGHLDAAEGALGRAAGGAPIDFDRLLRELHTLKGSAGAVGLARVAALAHALEDRALSARRRGPVVDEREAIAAALASLRLEVARTDGVGGGIAGIGDRERAPHADGRGDLRVDAEQVDHLMEAVGDLVLDRARIVRKLQDVDASLQRLDGVRAQLRAFAQPDGDGDGGEPAPETVALAAATIAESVSRVRQVLGALGGEVDGLRLTTRSLQDGLQRIRTVAVGKLYARLEPPLRELAQRSGRAVDVATSGDDTAIDRAMVDRLYEPLLQLVRNAIAHGIEPPERRVAAGKRPTGRITLSARQRGDRIVLEVEDDGAGVDLEGVRRALVRGGRARHEEALLLDEPALLASIFAPGISTRGDTDDLAGRGIGLDAVKETLARLGGTIACTSRAGHGTRFTVRLPLTTAIVPALLFKVGGQVYAVPSASVVADLDGQSSDPPEAAVPVTDLGVLFGDEPHPGAGAGADAAPEILLDGDAARFAVRCDKLIGEREIVVKGLGPLYQGLPLFAGATVSGAGKVQLILDVDELGRRVAHGARHGHPIVSGGAAPPPPSSRPRRVLVVDDSFAARAATTLLLERAGYLVDSAPDGEHAWALLAARPPDLLVTDSEMPGLDGYALVSRVRGDARLRELPILVVSASSPESAARCRSLGADDFVSKTDLATADLDARLRRLLDPR